MADETGDAAPTLEERIRQLEGERRTPREPSGPSLFARIASSKWWPTAVARGVGPFILGLVIAGTWFLIDGDEGEVNSKGETVTASDTAASNFSDLIAHLPTIGLILLISLVADFVAKWVMAQTWFDQHGSAQELGTIRSRVGTEDERPNDGIAAGMGFVGNRLFAAAVALALLLHFG